MNHDPKTSTLVNLMRSLVATAVLAAAPVVAADDPPAPDYTSKVAPILRKYCAGCHNDEDREGEFSVESFTSLQKGGERGPAIKPGDAASSRLIRADRCFEAGDASEGRAQAQRSRRGDPHGLDQCGRPGADGRTSRPTGARRSQDRLAGEGPAGDGGRTLRRRQVARGRPVRLGRAVRDLGRRAPARARRLPRQGDRRPFFGGRAPSRDRLGRRRPRRRGGSVEHRRRRADPPVHRPSRPAVRRRALPRRQDSGHGRLRPRDQALERRRRRAVADARRAQRGRLRAGVQP